MGEPARECCRANSSRREILRERRTVFQAYHAILDEAAAALDRAGQLLSALLAGAERVTA